MALYGWYKTRKKIKLWLERVERESESKLKSESWRVASDRIGFGTSIAERVPTCALHRGAVRRTAADGTNEATRDETIWDETRRDDTRRSGTTCGEGDKAKRGEASRTKPSQVESSRIGKRVSGWRLLGASSSLCGVCCSFALLANHVRSPVTALL